MYRNYYTNQPGFLSSSQFRGAIKWLIIINVAIFILQNVFDSWFLEVFGLIPYYVTRKFWVWQLASYMFLHGGFFHILMNLFVLWMFGKPVEDAWGTKSFLKYYFTCGIGASLLILATSFNSPVPTVGASGAIYGILVAFAMLYPDTVIYLYFLFPIRAKHFALLIGIISFLSGISGSSSNISHFGHLGGLIVGYIYIKYGVWKHRFEPLKFMRKSKTIKISQQDVNVILDKILTRGINSLTPEELKIMEEYSRIIRNN